MYGREALEAKESDEAHDALVAIIVGLRGVYGHAAIDAAWARLTSELERQTFDRIRQAAAMSREL